MHRALAVPTYDGMQRRSILAKLKHSASWTNEWPTQEGGSRGAKQDKVQKQILCYRRFTSDRNTCSLNDTSQTLSMPMVLKSRVKPVLNQQRIWRWAPHIWRERSGDAHSKPIPHHLTTYLIHSDPSSTAHVSTHDSVPALPRPVRSKMLLEKATMLLAASSHAAIIWCVSLNAFQKRVYALVSWSLENASD